MHIEPIEIASIHIPEDRQRKDLGNVDELAESISRLGLLQPIVITKDGILIAGERRLTACRQLGHVHIPAHFLEDLPPLEAKTIELEENVKRKDLTWQESALAVLELHELKEQINGEEWEQKDTADTLGMEQSEVSRAIMVGKELRKPDNKVSKADGIRPAYNIVKRHLRRAIDDELANIDLNVTGAFEAGNENEAPNETKPDNTAVATHNFNVESDVVKSSFLDWCQTNHEQKFNFIHCDFPYGVGYHKSDQAGTKHDRRGHTTYEDSEDVYFELLNAFITNLDNFCRPSAHIMFWLSPKFIRETEQAFARTNLTLWRFPLIWHKSDGKGILPDAERGPRYTYETALMLTRGDRRVVSPIFGSYSGPTNRAQSHHISAKPVAVLSHFFRLFVDDLSEVLDPTCGSGTALIAAESLGAKRVFGMDIEESYVDLSRDELLKSRKLAAAHDAVVKG